VIEHNNSHQGIRFLFIAAAVVIVIVGIHQAREVLALFLVSAFLAVIGTPQVYWLERKRIPSAIAVLIVIAGMIVILLMCGILVGTSIKSLSDALPFYHTRLQQQALALTKLLASFGIAVNNKALLAHVNPEEVNKWVVGSFAGASSAFSSSVLVLLTVSFILFEASSFPIKLRAALGEPRAHFPRFTKFVDDVKRYVVIQTAISLIAGVLIGIWLAVLRVDFAVLFGLLTFLLNYVPNVGSVIALVPIAILTLIQFGVGRAALASAGYVVVVFFLGNVVQPRLMGQKLGLSTLVVFISLLFWGSLLGLIGMVLCVPFTMALKFSLESNEDTRWIAVLLGRGPLTEKNSTMSKKGRKE
jgi:predicted PurR-regulated permease PerM